MTNGFDLLGRTRVLQIHWLKRICAFIVDAVLVLLLTWAVLTVLGVTEMVMFGLMSGFSFFLYSAISEAAVGQTPGKVLLRLKVRAERGNLTPAMAFVRSIPKFFWYLFPMIDALAGLAGEGDPRQRLSDRILGSTVAQAHYLRVKVHRLPTKKESDKPPAKA